MGIDGIIKPNYNLVYQAFKSFSTLDEKDGGQDGVITPSSKDPAAIKSCDSNRDGKITFDEFLSKRVQPSALGQEFGQPFYYHFNAIIKSLRGAGWNEKEIGALLTLVFNGSGDNLYNTLKEISGYLIAPAGTKMLENMENFSVEALQTFKKLDLLDSISRSSTNPTEKLTTALNAMATVSAIIIYNRSNASSTGQPFSPSEAYKTIISHLAINLLPSTEKRGLLWRVLCRQSRQLVSSQTTLSGLIIALKTADIGDLEISFLEELCQKGKISSGIELSSWLEKIRLLPDLFKLLIRKTYRN